MKPFNARSLRFVLPAALALVLVLGARAESVLPSPPTFAVAALLQETNKPWNQPVVLEGFVAAVCPRSGKKAWLHDTNSEAAGTVRVEAGTSPVFEKDLIGKTVRVTGILRELRMDAAYFDSWESRVKGSNTTIEKKDNCTEKCEENQSVDAALKRITALRAQAAKTANGCLSAFWVDSEHWEIVTAGARQ